ncbi:3-oxoacyl-ACP reductase [Haloferax gibbonsii ATCC 33959]|uniref:3-oxoacyl-ACP reductase n=1 Tax=Haloferax gibbonsii (strain ATCC 33959 / DSM 4427 / JCM 8863 / NBRC 102184 / NCIMB 2188 / Ma 2.38) TaxID=1227459 RepID=M0H067_HALGM|nr:glucose 1-dehydrogenase [Haloferax gibbonsii]ELZ77890.1 3-oxoacyl-ACP reductase [Haloferax gibbonsii ATCC 33959]
MKGIDGKVALVTGAASGIGRATALRFAEEGAMVALSDVQVDAGEQVVREIESEGGDAAFFEADSSKESDVASLVDRAVSEFGGLDFAHNNAGIEGTPGPIAEMSIEDFQRVIDINLTGVFLGLKYEIPRLVENGGGAIVNTSSVAGLTGGANLAHYYAAKHGVIGLTRSAALEVAAENVRVNAVCPGVIETPMIERFTAGDDEARAGLLEDEPIGRLGKPEEIASAVVYLCSDDASFVTGHPMVVDGGYVVP